MVSIKILINKFHGGNSYFRAVKKPLWEIYRAIIVRENFFKCQYCLNKSSLKYYLQNEKKGNVHRSSVHFTFNIWPTVWHNLNCYLFHMLHGHDRSTKL